MYVYVGVDLTHIPLHADMFNSILWWAPYLAGGLFLLVATSLLLASLYLVHIHRKFSHIPSPRMDRWGYMMTFILCHMAPHVLHSLYHGNKYIVLSFP